VVPIAQSTSYRHKAQHREPATRSARAREGEELRKTIAAKIAMMPARVAICRMADRTAAERPVDRRRGR
jgi:hypothetical protein